MPVRDKTTLKSYFNDGDVPSEVDYIDLIDTMFDGAGAGYVLHADTHKNGGADEVATSTAGPNLIPKANGSGKLDLGWLPALITDHGDLTGLADNDHPQYARPTENEDVTGWWSFGTEIVRPPFRITALTQGQTVAGFKADSLNKTITANAGLSGGGALDSNLTIGVDFDYPFLWNSDHQHAGSIFPSISDTYDLGSSTKLWRKGWLSELDTILFAQNTITTLGGWFMVSKGEGAIPTDIPSETGSHSYTFTSSASLEVNDFIIFRLAGQVEYMQVTAVASPDFTVTRNVDGSGANVWPAGSVFVNLGYTNDGRIELNATDTPRINMIKQGATYSAQTEMLRIGDLNGGWGYVAENFGLAIGDYGTNKPNLTFDATNGIRIRNNTTTVMQFDVAGNATITNKLRMPDSTSAITIGATPPTSATVGTGLWLDRTGMYGLAANVLQAKFDAVTGKITAGAGAVSLDTNGLSIAVGTGVTNSIKFMSGAVNTASIYSSQSGDANHHNLMIRSNSAGSAKSGTISISATDETYAPTRTLDMSMVAGVGFDFSATAGSPTFKITGMPVVIATVDPSITVSASIDNEINTAPANPASTHLREYALTGGYPLSRNSSGVVIPRFVSRIQIDIFGCALAGAAVAAVATNAKGIAFRDAQTDILDFNFTVPPGFGGKDVTFNAYWVPSSTNVGGVILSAEFRRIAHGVTMAAGASDTSNSTPTSPGIIDRVVKTAFAGLAMSGEGEAVSLRFFRSGTGGGDTFTGSFILVAAEFVLV